MPKLSLRHKDPLKVIAQLKDPSFILACIALISALYVFGIREQWTTVVCHSKSQQEAKLVMQKRAVQSPENTQLRSAADASLYANEDYNPIFKKCMVSHGFFVTL